MGFTVSTFAHHIGLLDPKLGGLSLQGAHLASARYLRFFAADPRIDHLEIFVQSIDYLNMDALVAAAQHLLPEHRRGKGVLSFFPIQNLPDVFADGRERIWWGQDIDWLARDRYLRDRFAVVATPIVTDTHALGETRTWPVLQKMLGVPPVPYDVLACISRPYMEAVRLSFEHFGAQEASPVADLPLSLEFVPRAVEMDRFAPADASTKERTRHTLGLPVNSTILLSHGRITPHDKADLRPLIRAFAKVVGPTDLLVISGREDAEGAYALLEEEALVCEVADRVRFIPNPSFGAEILYQAADAFVFLSDTVQEALGTTLVEAAACGLPIVAADWVGAQDVVEDGVNGIRVPTYWLPGLDRLESMSPAGRRATNYLVQAQSVWFDTEALADALDQVLRDRDIRARMGAASVKQVSSYSREAVMSRLCEVFERSLALAREESEEDRAGRAKSAERLGCPTPYLDVFAHYATGVLPNTSRLIRNDRANLALKAQALPLLPELQPWIHVPVLLAILDRLEFEVRFQMVVGEVSATTHLDANDVVRHVGFLMKAGLIDCTVEEPG